MANYGDNCRASFRSIDLFELSFQISNVRLPLDRLAGYAADEFVHRELATVLIKVRRCPVQQRIEFAASDVVRDARDILHRFVEELRREKIAKRIDRKSTRLNSSHRC